MMKTLRRALWTTKNAAIARMFALLKPREVISTRDWADKYRIFHPSEGAGRGHYRVETIPYLTWPNSPLCALDDPNVVEVVAQKSAQVAWTTGVMGNYIAMRICEDPAPILAMFPKDESAKDWNKEKLEPMIEATPALSKLINLASKRQTQKFKRFPGGFLKAVGSNSPASVKSSPIPVVVVEEPDDCNLNLRGQGDSIALAKERTKSYPRSRVKMIIGGTPTIDGISTVQAEMQLSDKRYGMVPCHECGHHQVLDFERFLIPEKPGADHVIYGNKDPDNAGYICEGCGIIWTFEQKNRNLRQDCYWQATADFRGIAGFYINELYSAFPGSHFKLLAEKKLLADHDASLGRMEKRIAFINSSCGQPYKYAYKQKDADQLKLAALDYEMGTVPEGGLILTAGVDVQLDRLEIVVRAWGRHDQSWLIWREKLIGETSHIDSECWIELKKLFSRSFKTASGKELLIQKVSIDSGFLSDLVYKFVRANSKLTLAIKGRSDTDREIFSLPSKVDTNPRNTKKDRHGLSVYLVGTEKAKDLIVETWLGFVGTPKQVFFYPADVGDTYFEELLNEIKAPNKNGRLVWQRKAGKRVEALDCEVYALHAARSLRIHRFSDKDWDKYEQSRKQRDLFDGATAASPTDQKTGKARNLLDDDY